jgi:hypothetical protein
MGKEIVYCGGCGKSLLEDDFSRGKAHTVDNRPFCTTCKPRTGPDPNQTSSRLSAMKSSTARHLPAVTPATTRRRRERDSSKAPLIVGGALVGVGLLLLVIFLSASGSKPSEPPPPDPAPAPKSAVAPKPASTPKEPDRAALALKDLEAFAATSPQPVALLQRCDEARQALQGTPHEAGLKRIEDQARESHRALQVESSLQEVKRLRTNDSEFERKDEILGLLNATVSLAGPRKGEIEELIRAYTKDAEAFAKKPAPPQPKPVPKPAPKPPKPPLVSASSLGPFDTDSHGAVNHWLVLGPFANRNHREGLYDHDLLRPELKHVPAAGLLMNTRETAKVRWTPAVVTEGKVQFRQLEGLGPEWKSTQPAIAFAACWIVAESDMEVKFRINAEQGGYLIMDEKRIRNLGVAPSLADPADVINVKLSKGPHLLIFKVATVDEKLALRFRVTTIPGDRAPGLKVWNQPPVDRRSLQALSFNDGPGLFRNGELVDGGVDGSKAYAIHQKRVIAEHLFKEPVTAETTIRVKLKPIAESKSFMAMIWSPKNRVNCWFHIKNLKQGEWNLVEFKVSAARGGYRMDGPGLEGEVPGSLTFYHDDTAADARYLLDDFELLE